MSLIASGIGGAFSAGSAFIQVQAAKSAASKQQKIAAQQSIAFGKEFETFLFLAAGGTLIFFAVYLIAKRV